MLSTLAKTLVTVILLVGLFFATYLGMSLVMEWTMEGIDQSEPDYTKPTLSVEPTTDAQTIQFNQQGVKQ